MDEALGSIPCYAMKPQVSFKVMNGRKAVGAGTITKVVMYVQPQGVDGLELVLKTDVFFAGAREAAEVSIDIEDTNKSAWKPVHGSGLIALDKEQGIKQQLDLVAQLDLDHWYRYSSSIDTLVINSAGTSISLDLSGYGDMVRDAASALGAAYHLKIGHRYAPRLFWGPMRLTD